MYHFSFTYLKNDLSFGVDSHFCITNFPSNFMQHSSWIKQFWSFLLTDFLLSKSVQVYYICLFTQSKITPGLDWFDIGGKRWSVIIQYEITFKREFYKWGLKTIQTYSFNSHYGKPCGKQQSPYCQWHLGETKLDIFHLSIIPHSKIVLIKGATEFEIDDIKNLDRILPKMTALPTH